MSRHISVPICFAKYIFIHKYMVFDYGPRNVLIKIDLIITSCNLHTNVLDNLFIELSLFVFAVNSECDIYKYNTIINMLPVVMSNN